MLIPLLALTRREPTSMQAHYWEASEGPFFSVTTTTVIRTPIIDGEAQGVAQGSPVFPVLFAIYVVEIHSSVE